MGFTFPHLAERQEKENAKAGTSETVAARLREYAVKQNR